MAYARGKGICRSEDYARWPNDEFYKSVPGMHSTQGTEEPFECTLRGGPKGLRVGLNLLEGCICPLELIRLPCPAYHIMVTMGVDAFRDLTSR